MKYMARLGLAMSIIKSLGHTLSVELSDRFESVCAELGVGRASADFYPYAELKHTWRCRGRSIVFKISDYLKGSPEEVLDSLAWYLVCRAYGRECPPEKSEPYLAYSHSRDLWMRRKRDYLFRAKNLDIRPRGENRDLRVVFDYVNFNYFKGRIRDPILAWVTESPSRRLGFYFGPLNLLAVNRSFDSDRVPRYALEFVMYHELLHHMDALNGRPRRRVHHTRSFKEQERLFSSYSEAEAWLRKLASEWRTRRR